MMRIKPLPQNVATGIVTFLRPYCPKISETYLLEALKEFDPEKSAEQKAEDKLPRFVGTAKAAKLLDMSQKTLIKLLHDSSIPLNAITLGGKLLVPLKQIQDLETQVFPASPATAES